GRAALLAGALGQVDDGDYFSCRLGRDRQRLAEQKMVGHVAIKTVPVAGADGDGRLALVAVAIADDAQAVLAVPALLLDGAQRTENTPARFPDGRDVAGLDRGAAAAFEANVRAGVILDAHLRPAE